MQDSDNGFDIAGLLDQAEGLALTWGMKVLGAIAVLILGWIIARMARRSIARLFKRTDFDETLEVFFTRLAYWTILAATVIAVLGTFGVQTASIIAVFASAGLAIGLAMQGSLSNFSSGVMILIFRPFSLGDFIEASGVTGTVSAIGLFSTELNTPDNVHTVIPNGSIFGEIIKNYNVNANRRNDIVLGIGYDDDIAKALEIVERVVTEDSRVLADPEPVFAVGELGDSSVNLVIRPWCKREDYWAVRWDLLRRLKEELEAGGCSIPYPQTDVHLHTAASEEG